MKGHVPTPEPVVDDMVAKLFAARKPAKGDVLIDPGCGDGAFLRGAIRHCRAAELPLPELIGVELDPARAKEARRALGGTATILEADYLTADLPKATHVIGNPPYVSLPALSAAERKKYRSKFKVATGRFDLYSLFMERSLDLLEPGGAMVFITPEKYQYVQSAEALRGMLAKRGVLELDFQDHDSFPGRVTYPVITTVAKAGKTRIVGRDRRRKEVHLPRNGESWNGVINGARRKTSTHVALESLCLRISPGVASGCEEVFVVEPGKVETRFLKDAYPTISGRQLLKNGVKPTEYLLCPYDEHGKLRAPEDMPDLIEWLGNQKTKLEKRTCVANGRKWYQYHDTFPAKDILQPKILCKDITQEPRFWIDRQGGIVPRHSVYYIVPKAGVDIEKLYDYLNGDAATKWLQVHSQRAAHGYYRLQSAVLRRLPVPPTMVEAKT